jgi:NADPH-ferrihemoprotein reductase
VVLFFSFHSLEEDFSAWKKELWPALCKHFALDVKISANDAHQARFTIKYHPQDSNEAAAAAKAKHLFKKPPKGQERYFLFPFLLSPLLNPPPPFCRVYEYKNPYFAKVLVNRELHSELSDRSCRHIELDIGNELS